MSKRKKLLLLALLAFMQAGAQETMPYLEYAFENDQMPVGLTIYDLDGKTPHFTAEQMGFDQGQAWICMREDNVYPYNYFVASHSRHKKVTGVETEAANDWLVLPSLLVRSEDAMLSWRSNSVCENLETTSTYHIKVALQGEKPEDFTENLITVDSDPINGWCEHKVSLAKYAGKRVSLAFVNQTYNGELLAVDDIVISGGKGAYEFTTNLAPYVCGQQQFTPQLTFTNLSDKDIRGFVVRVRDIDPLSSKGRDIRVDETIASHASKTVDIQSEMSVVYGDTLKQWVNVEVDGVQSDAVTTSTVFLSFEPRQHIVIEEGTGNWCGWCPKGIYAIQVLLEKYGNTVLPICVHSDDVMEVEGYISDEGVRFPLGYPSGRINRKYESEPLAEVHEGRKSIFTTLHGGFETWVLKELECKPMAEVTVVAQLLDKTINLTSQTTFCMPQQGTDLRMAYIITEDWKNSGLAQKNYLAGNSDYETIGDFSSQPSAIKNFDFEFVARGAAQKAFGGIKGAIPSDVEVDKVYTHTTSMSIPAAVSDIQNCDVTAMLIDHKTGHIVNAARVKVMGGANQIDLIEGDAKSQPSALYDLQGRKISQLAKGIYIKGGKKVMY